MRSYCLFPQFTDDYTAKANIEETDEKNDCKARRHNDPFKTVKEPSLAAPIQEQRSEADGDALKHGDVQKRGE